LYGFAARSLIKDASLIAGLFRSAADHTIARELASSLRWAFEVQIQFSRKSLSFFVVLAVLLVPIFFLSVRFLPKDTATQHDQIRSHIPSDTAERPKAHEPAEPPPDRTIKELVHTWNQGNAEDIARLFMSDGTLIIPPGSQIQSRPEIRKTISEKRSGVLKQTRLSNTIDKVLRPDPETAVVQGTYKLDGIKILGFSTSATGSYKLRQVKRQGRWFIARAEVTKGDHG
jgi:uncharacterized protein (TIGR02246 family)